MNSEVAGKPLLSVRETARRLGISESTAYEWARRDELPGLVKLGGRPYVRAAVLTRFIDGDEIAALSDPAAPAAERTRATSRV